jgi:colanic acid/amylovoran biosynthesis glycosyltransferase
MRLAIISSRFPYGNGEPFLKAEIASLRPHVDALFVAPLRPKGWASGAATWILAFRAIRRAPFGAFEALRWILSGRCRVRVKLKNLAIFPRALALAEQLHRAQVDHVHAYWISAPATAAFVVARVNGIAWSSSAHRWDIFEGNMLAEKVRSAAFVRAISERGKSELARRVPGSENKLVLVRLGTALQATRTLLPPRRCRTFRILCAAAFYPVKAHGDLLQAFAMAHKIDASVRLDLCGSGPLEATVRRNIDALECSDAIAMRGYVPRSQLLRELTRGEYDAVVLASRDDGVSMMEGIPSILIEAASLGVACIATRSGAVGELLDTESAFLAPAGRPLLLANAILAARNDEERRRRAARAQARARLLHDPRASASRLAGFLGALA